MSMISRIGFLLSLGFYHILFWKSMDRFGKMRGPPRDAIVAGHSRKKGRGRAFGILRALDTAGALVGAIITYVLFAHLGYIGIIVLAAVPGVGSVILVTVLVKEKRGLDVFKGITFRGLDSNLKLFLAASVLFALATLSYSFLLLLSRGLGYAETELPLLYILFTFVYAVSAYPFGRLSDRVGRRPVLLLAYLFTIFTAIWVHFVSDLLSVLPLFVFFGLSSGALDPVQTTLVADLVDEERRASVIGAFKTAVGLTALPAGAIIGYLWHSFGHLVSFQYSLALATIAVILLLFVRTTE